MRKTGSETKNRGEISDLTGAKEPVWTKIQCIWDV